MDTIPNYYSYKIPIEARKDTIHFKPYYGPSQSRGFGGGEAQHNWELGDDDTDHDNFLEIKAFWVAKYPGVDFYLYDPQLNETRVYEIRSNFSEHRNHQDSYSWKFRIEEVFPYAVIEGPPPEP